MRLTTRSNMSLYSSNAMRATVSKKQTEAELMAYPVKITRMRIWGLKHVLKISGSEVSWIRFCFSRIYCITKESVAIMSRQEAAISFNERSAVHIGFLAQIY